MTSMEEVHFHGSATKEPKAWPDDRAYFRLSVFYGMLPATMAVTAAISRGRDMQPQP